MRIAIMQPYFIPYIGYFQLIASVDKFVVYDDVNYITKGWVNRNNALVNNASHMITIPLSNGKRDVLICDVLVSQQNEIWKAKLLKTIKFAYAKAPMFLDVFPWFEGVIMSNLGSISQLNVQVIQWICNRCSIPTEIIATSTIYGNRELGRAERLADICKQENADIYINSAGGRLLYQQSMFSQYGIELRFLEPKLVTYRQLSKKFIPGLSILDVLMNCEPEEIEKMMQSGSVLK